MHVRKNAPLRTALIKTPFKKWPWFARNHAGDILRTIRGKKILEAMRARKRGAKIKLVDLMFEEPLSIEDL